MRLSVPQMQTIGEMADKFEDGKGVVLEETNLQNGTTVVLMGKDVDTRVELTILIRLNGNAVEM